jgi:hypothetical protein
MTTFYCLRFETLRTWRTRSPYLHPPGTRWPSSTPRHWVHFSSAPTARRAAVEVFDPVFKRDTDLNSRINSILLLPMNRTEITASMCCSLLFVNALSRKPCIYSKATVAFLCVYNFQFPYPRKPCSVTSWFPRIISVATYLLIRVLERAHISRYT